MPTSLKQNNKDKRVEEPMHTLPSLSVRLLTHPRTIEMTSNFRFLLIAEMMQFILVPSIWDLLQVNQQEWSSILDRNIWLLPVFSVMTKQQEITNLRSMILFRVVLSRETRFIRDVKLWLMTCTSLIPIRYCLKLRRNSLMDPLSSRDSYGKITLASSR